MQTNQYRIGQLAEKAGVTRRTIHYYTGRGLLPPPEGAGISTTYSDEHLYRIMLIKKLQDAYLPLDEIKKIITVMPLNQVKESLNKEIVPINVQEKVLATVPQIEIGNLYKRIPIGYGAELHFPADNKQAQKLAEKLYEYAENIMKEG